MAASLPPSSAAVPDVSGVPLRGRRARAFARVLPRAADLAIDRVRALRVAKQAYRRLAASGDGNALGQVSEEARTLIRMVSAYARGEYRRVPVKSAVYAIGALVYFLSPLDLVPDFIPIIGLLDDAAIVAAVVTSLAKDLDAFRAWEIRRAPAGQAARPSLLRRITRRP